MKHHWTKTELELLGRYDRLGNELSREHPDEISEDMLVRYLELEGTLLIQNKYVIGYIDSEAIGIYSFNEALCNETIYSKRGKIFDFHPVNFINQDQFSDFLNLSI